MISTDRKKSWPWKRSLAWLVFLAPFFYITYGFTNAWAAERWANGEVTYIVFDWEHHIPFLSWTIFPYWSINFFYGLSLFLNRSKHRINRHGLRLLTAQIIAVSCFMLWPLHFSFGQPEAEGVAGVLFDALRGFDQPFNQAPSLHIALAVILWDWYRPLMRNLWQRWILHIWTFTVCASVLTTYQHHFIDIPTGLLLGVLCVWLWPLEREVALIKVWRLSRDKQRIKLGLLYLVAGITLSSIGLWLGGSALWLIWPSISLTLVAANYLVFGARGFRMSRTGQMHWSTRWLLAPYLMAASVNVWAWTRKLPSKNEVVEGVWLGRRPSYDEWLTAGQPTIVSLCAELPLPSKIVESSCRCLPLLDLVVPPASRLKQAASIVEAQRRAYPDKPVLVCCALGFSRSAAAVIAWQLLYNNTDLLQAETKTRQARPQLVLGPSWYISLSQLNSIISNNVAKREMF